MIISPQGGDIMSRRKKGEGSYGERMINGIKYRYYKFPNGKIVYGKTLKEVNEKKQAYLESPESRTVSTNIIFSDYCYRWLKQKKRITEKTRQDYERLIDLHIKPYSIGFRPINSLTSQMCSKYLEELSSDYALATIKRTWAVVVQVIRHGMESKEIPIFPINNIVKPTEDTVVSKKKEVKFISEEDMNAVYEEAKKERYGNTGWLFIFIMYSGVRAAEAMCLQWGDITPDFKKVHVQRSMQKVKKRDENGDFIKVNGKYVYEYIEKSVKTTAGDRVIPLPKRGIEALNKMSKREHSNTDLVFISNTGMKYTHNMLIKPLKMILKRSDSKIKNYSPHDLRRGYGSILLSKGTNIAVISKLLGHSKVSTTLNIYTKPFDKDVEDAVAKFDE